MVAGGGGNNNNNSSSTDPESTTAPTPAPNTKPTHSLTHSLRGCLPTVGASALPSSSPPVLSEAHLFIRIYRHSPPAQPSCQPNPPSWAGFIKVLPKHQLVCNPDCGLKTRTWPQVKSSPISDIKALPLRLFSSNLAGNRDRTSNIEIEYRESVNFRKYRTKRPVNFRKIARNIEIGVL